jgi:biotin carboxylase
MAKTLLVDTNRAAVPIYRALEAVGHEVWVVGGKPAEPLAKMSPRFVELDYSDTGKLSDLIDRERFEFIVPGCTDVSYKACAEVSAGKFPGIDSVETTRAINDKSDFRKLAEEIGLPVPKLLAFDEAPKHQSVIVKPVDSFSGRGISILKDPKCESLDAALAQARAASKSGSALIEEFVTGQLYSHSAFMRGGKVFVDFVVQEDCVANPFAVDLSRVVWDFPEKVRNELREEVERLAARLSLADSLIHTQFIADADKHWIIEMTRRSPGDLYSLLIEYSTGYPYAASYTAPFIGLSAAPADTAVERHFIIRHTACPPEATSFFGLMFSRPVDLQLIVPLALVGDSLETGPSGRSALIFVRCATKQEQNVDYQSLLDGKLLEFRR